MKGIKRMKLGLVGIAAVALLAVGGFLLASQVSAAATGTLSIGSATIAPGATGHVDMKESTTSPGLGAWTVDITYDPAVVDVPTGGCVAEQNGVCNPAYTANQIRITGASAGGLQGEKVLGTITFHCRVAGTSALTLVANVFADATIGAPASFTPTTTNGAITCAVPAPTATPLPTLVVVGTGPASDGGFGYSWLIAGLTAAGMAGLAGYTALRLRARAR